MIHLKAVRILKNRVILPLNDVDVFLYFLPDAFHRTTLAGGTWNRRRLVPSFAALLVLDTSRLVLCFRRDAEKQGTIQYITECAIPLLLLRIARAPTATPIATSCQPGIVPTNGNRQPHARHTGNRLLLLFSLAHQTLRVRSTSILVR